MECFETMEALENVDETRQTAQILKEVTCSRFRNTSTGLQAAAKNASKTAPAEKRPQDKTRKRPQDTPKKRHDIINPVRLCGVVTEAELKARLKAKGHLAWSTHVRTCGLLLIIDYASRQLKKG